MDRIYVDCAATTPLDPRVFDAMLPYLKEHFGNASSVHALGRKARHAIEDSRERVAALVGAEPAEIVFTSGGTEADNQALRGRLRAQRDHLITSAAEHKAVLEPAKAWKAQGGRASILSVSAAGAVSSEQVAEAVDDDTTLVSLMYVNNETGTLTPISAIADVCRRRGTVFHCDAVQAAGLLELNVEALGVDMLSVSGHKIYGPKGVGVLYIRAGTDLEPSVRGGGQERGRRGGTENVPAIVGIAKALELARDERDVRAVHVRGLRDRLYRQMREALGDAFVSNTPLEGPSEAAPHILNVSFPPANGEPLDGEMLLLNLDMAGVMASAGSACTSGALEPSHVLLAIGRDRATAGATLRFSLGAGNTEAEIDRTVELLAGILRRMRAAAFPA